MTVAVDMITRLMEERRQAEDRALAYARWGDKLSMALKNIELISTEDNIVYFAKTAATKAERELEGAIYGSA